MSGGRALDHGCPGTPLAWQQRDLNYQAGGHRPAPPSHHGAPSHYDRYPPTPSRPGPPSTSDRLSHRSGDKSWGAPPPLLVPYSNPRAPPSTARPPSRPRSPSPTSSSSSSSSSSSTEESERVGVPGPPMLYPGMYPPGPHGPLGTPGPPGTVKSARSVPALALATWDGEPCPVHGGAPMPAPYHGPPPPMGPPPPRRGTSIYDLRGTYATLPARPPPGDRRSLAGSGLAPPPPPGAPHGIPPHLLPPMARPLPLVVDEKGHAEPLPVRRAPGDKGGGGVVSKAGSVVGDVCEIGVEGGGKGGGRCPGGWCVAWVILALVCGGVLLALMLTFIL
ncbi:hypothetical protein E2C01_099720 [Portunus trituberculatus]|uniref:Uncharacterized protein n=1 Tax=Portunus trituberculatus TaxID=210409 RepID=A0A5B7K4I4_PORTR|nr:hypothetical protein [Portunus trituberculatus]